MIKEIVVYPNDILTTPTKKTDLKTAQNLAVELFKTLKQEGGLGLSANQVGEDKSVCVVNVTNPFFLLNPVIIKKQKEEKRIKNIIFYVVFLKFWPLDARIQQI